MAEGGQVYTGLGYSVDTAGDVNGDGYDDVIIGADGYENGQMNEGMAVVYHGAPSGLSHFIGWMIESNQEQAYFGDSVATAGDVNGDGYDDVIVGTPYYTNNQSLDGMAAVYHGASNGLDLVPDWIGEGNQEAAWF
jgi:hypothetical protein